MELENIVRYYPDEMPFGEDVEYYVDEKGRDWYNSLKYFNKPHVISYDPQTKIIHSYSADASAIHPVGLNVVDIDIVPDGFDIADNWLYRDGQILREFAAEAEVRRQTLLEEANKRMAEWVIDLQLGIISNDEKDSLIAWRNYIKSLKAMDFSSVVDESSYDAIRWPLEP